MSNPKQRKPVQATLPGLERSAAKVRSPIRPALKELGGQNPTPPPARRPYDDTARGYVGVPHSRTETSKAAAEKIHPLAAKQRRRVWEYVHGLGGTGATVDEVSVALELPTNSVTPRFWELRKYGYLEKTEAKRNTRYGTPARVHVAVELVGPALEADQ